MCRWAGESVARRSPRAMPPGWARGIAARGGATSPQKRNGCCVRIAALAPRLETSCNPPAPNHGGKMSRRAALPPAARRPGRQRSGSGRLSWPVFIPAGPDRGSRTRGAPPPGYHIGGGASLQVGQNSLIVTRGRLVQAACCREPPQVTGCSAARSPRRTCSPIPGRAAHPRSDRRWLRCAVCTRRYRARVPERCRHHCPGERSRC